MAQKHMPPALYKQRLEDALAIVRKHVDHKAIINPNSTGIKYHCYDGHTRQWLPKRDAVTGELFLTKAGAMIDTPQLVRVPKFMPASAAFKMLEELGG